MSDRRARVLLVDDDPDFVLLACRAWKKAEVPGALEVVRDGEAAVTCLGGAASCPPALLILDLKLPKLSGFELLRWVRSHPSLAALPAVVLTSSGVDRDREEVTKIGAAEYRVKPAGFGELVSVFREIGRRWLAVQDP
jgi:two-component system response regulator